MSAILAMTTAIVLVLLSIIKKKRSRVSTPVLVKRYVHRGHSWARETEDGDVLVGMDDFAQSIIGAIDDFKLPRLLRKVRQGEVGWYVWHGHRVAPMVSPVTGRVVEKNEMIMRNPSLANTAPYGDGWLLRIRPQKLAPQLVNLFAGKTAQQWQTYAKERLTSFFASTPALMYQDGGVPVKNLSDRCSDQEWNTLIEEFFLVPGRQSSGKVGK
jgi:glycine cleavage system H protein